MKERTSTLTAHPDRWAPGPRHLKSVLFSSPCACQVRHSITFWQGLGWFSSGLSVRSGRNHTSLSDQHLMMTQSYQESRFIIECSYLFLVKCAIFSYSPRMIHKPCFSRQTKVGGGRELNNCLGTLNQYRCDISFGAFFYYIFLNYPLSLHNIVLTNRSFFISYIRNDSY